MGFQEIPGTNWEVYQSFLEFSGDLKFKVIQVVNMNFREYYDAIRCNQEYQVLFCNLIAASESDGGLVLMMASPSRLSFKKEYITLPML